MEAIHETLLVLQDDEAVFVAVNLRAALVLRIDLSLHVEITNSSNIRPNLLLRGFGLTFPEKMQLGATKRICAVVTDLSLLSPRSAII